MEIVVQQEVIEGKIYMIRGHKVMLDSDLAELYDVQPKVLLQAVRRNIKRFPADFMFQLKNQEIVALRSQIVTLKRGRGQHRKYAPYVFTEQGVAMLSSVLKSERAIQVNIAIMRAFVKLRQIVQGNRYIRIFFPKSLLEYCECTLIKGYCLLKSALGLIKRC